MNDKLMRILVKIMVIISKIIFAFFVWFVLLLLVLLGVAWISGHTERAYPVLSEDSVLKIGDQELTTQEIGLFYKPIMRIRSKYPTPDLLWLYYEVIDFDCEDTLDIVYYFVWENEIHPIPLVNSYYSVFRSAYYGYPLYDIEFFQVTVDRKTGLVLKILFETTLADDYFVTVSQHITASYTRVENGYYNVLLTDNSGRMLKEEGNLSIDFQDFNILVGNATWNHLMVLIHSSDDEFDTELNKPLVYLTNEEYSQKKFVRKSQGDHKTDENMISKILGSLVMVIFVLIPAWMIRKIYRKNSQDN